MRLDPPGRPDALNSRRADAVRGFRDLHQGRRNQSQIGVSNESVANSRRSYERGEMATATRDKTPGQLFALVFGAVYLLGLVGALQWLSIESGLNADQFLHLFSGGLGVYFGTAGATARRPVTA